MKNPMVWLVALLLVTASGLSGQRAAPPGQLNVSFGDAATISSNDGGDSWFVSAGTKEGVPQWAHSWLREGAEKVWTPRGRTLRFGPELALTQSSENDPWVMLEGQPQDLPSWAQRWLERPRPVEAASAAASCTSAKPMHDSRNLKFGDGLAIQSQDGGKTWRMTEGSVDELPTWIQPWLEAPAEEAQLTQNLVFPGATIQSLDGGKSWKVTEGHRAELPYWVQPWLATPESTAKVGMLAPTGPAPKLELYPNPAGQQVTLRFDLSESESITLAIYDLQGRVVQSLSPEVRPAGEQEWTISLGDLTAGSYLLEWKGREASVRHPLVHIDE